jgi:hypothetical protein
MRPQSPPSTKRPIRNNHGAGASRHHHPLPNTAYTFQKKPPAEYARTDWPAASRKLEVYFAPFGTGAITNIAKG